MERVARIVSSVRTINPDYARLAAELAASIPFDIFGVVLLRHDRQAVRVIVCQHEHGSWGARNHQHPLQDSRFEQIMSTSTTLIESHPTGLQGPPTTSGDALSSFHQLRSILITPLLVDDIVIGSLELGSVALDTYADQTLQRLIIAAARVLANAIYGAQAGGSAEMQDRQRQALKDVSSALTSSLELPTILNQIVTGLSRSLNVAAIVLVNAQRQSFGASEEALAPGKLRVAAQTGLDEATLTGIVNNNMFHTEQTIVGYTLLHRQPCVTHDIAIDERFPASQQLCAELGIRSLFSYPLVASTTVYGALLLCSPEPGGFSPLKADIFSLFASQATIAIHNAMLIEAAHQRRRFQLAIEQLEYAHEQGLDERELLAHVRHEAQHAFGISLKSLLSFVSDHLLTRNERDLHALLYPDHQEDSLALLTQTAEDALTRAEVLGELSRLGIYQHDSTSQIKDAWFVVNLQGHCLYTNPAGEALCGISSIPGAHVTLLQTFSRFLNRARNADEVYAYLAEFGSSLLPAKEIRCVLAHPPDQLDHPHSDHYYTFTRHALNGLHSSLQANILIVQDITEQVHDERNKSALLSSVSHELRTPLTTIKAGVTGLLQDGIVWDEAMRREILEEIDSETDHLSTLINEMVEMSRIEMGALILEKEWCDILEIIHGALSRLQQTHPSPPLSVNINCPSSHNVTPAMPLPLIHVDHVQLERVFIHLLTYIAHHIPIGTEIDILLHSDGSLLSIQVIDPGVSVPLSAHERSLEPFYARNKQDHGLGLAICRGIIEAHKGHIWVEAAPDGVGTCFLCTLPLHMYGTIPSAHRTPSGQHAHVDTNTHGFLHEPVPPKEAL